MNENHGRDRVALLQAAAAAEQELIDAEQEAERALVKAEARLEKTSKEFRRLKRELRDRTEQVNTARATLAAVRKRRADGPG